MSAAKKSPSKPRTTPLKDPREMARQAVAKCFDQITAAHQAFTAGSVFAATLDDTLVDDLINALMQRERADRARVGRMDADDEDLIRDFREVFATEAGYLIGVQVGLRLRTEGAR